MLLGPSYTGESIGQACSSSVSLANSSRIVLSMAEELASERLSRRNCVISLGRLSQSVTEGRVYKRARQSAR